MVGAAGGFPTPPPPLPVLLPPPHPHSKALDQRIAASITPSSRIASAFALESNNLPRCSLFNVRQTPASNTGTLTAAAPSPVEPSFAPCPSGIRPCCHLPEPRDGKESPPRPRSSHTRAPRRERPYTRP